MRKFVCKFIIFNQKLLLLNELILELSEINPREFFGHHNSNIELIKKYYPQLKFVARGNKIKVFGEDDRLEEFEQRFQMLIDHFSKFNSLDENAIESILTSQSKADYDAPYIFWSCSCSRYWWSTYKSSNRQSKKTGRVDEYQ